MIRVYLFSGKHPLYETLLSHPPEDVIIITNTTGGGGNYTLYDSGYSVLRRIADLSYSMFKLPRYLPVMKCYDLVHSSRGFLVLGPNQFVVDVEHVSSFVGMNHRKLHVPVTRKLIQKSLASDKCIGLLPHSRAAMNTLSLINPSRAIWDKSTVLYPAVRFREEMATKRTGEVPSLLFMGEYYWKGGREVIRACSRLARSVDFNLTYISLRVPPPPDVLNEARQSMDMSYYEGPIPREFLFTQIYPRTDIFVMPTYIDTFGYAYLEAMAHGIPCVGTNHFAVPEIIENGVTGFTVDPPVSYFDGNGLGHPELPIADIDTEDTVNELKTVISQLIDSSRLRIQMGYEAVRLVRSGKFSVQRRNAILREVYEQSKHA